MDSTSDELCAKCYVCAKCDACTMCIFILRYQMHSKILWNLISPTSHILHTLQCPLQPLATPRSPSLTSCESSPHPCMSSSIPLRLTTTTLPKKGCCKVLFESEWALQTVKADDLHWAGNFAPHILQSMWPHFSTLYALFWDQIINVSVSKLIPKSQS